MCKMWLQWCFPRRRSRSDRTSRTSIVRSCTPTGTVPKHNPPARLRTDPDAAAAVQRRVRRSAWGVHRFYAAADEADATRRQAALLEVGETVVTAILDLPLRNALPEHRAELATRSGWADRQAQRPGTRLWSHVPVSGAGRCPQARAVVTNHHGMGVRGQGQGRSGRKGEAVCPSVAPRFRDPCGPAWRCRETCQAAHGSVAVLSRPMLNVRASVDA